MRFIHSFFSWQKRNIEPIQKFPVIKHVFYTLLSFLVVAALMFGVMKFFQMAFVSMSERWQEISQHHDKSQ